MSEAPPTDPAPDPAPAPDSAPAPSAPAQARTFVAEAARWRGLAVTILFGALLALQLHSFTTSPRNFTTYFGLGLCAVLAVYSLTPVVWPPRVLVSPEVFEVVGPPRLRAALENVDTVVYDGEGMGVIFVDLDEVEAEEEAVRAKLTQNESEGRPHAQVPGLSFEQVEEVRQLLGEEPPPADEPAGRVEAFYRGLLMRERPVAPAEPAAVPGGVERGPVVLAGQRPLATWGLIVVNVAVAVAMLMLGVNPFRPTLNELVNWGADFAPFTLNGQWWRLFSSLFVHVSLLHLAVTLWLLYDLGSLLERMLGPVVFVALYLVCGVASGLAAVAFGSTALSAGSSGAVLGLAGALAGMVFLSRYAVPREVFWRLRVSGLAFVALSVVYAFLVPGVDAAALVGGAVAGLLGGMILTRPRAQALALAAAGCAALAVAAVLLPRPPQDYGQFLLAEEDFEALNPKALKNYNRVIEEYQETDMTAPEAADRLEQEVLSPWRDLHDRLAAVKHAPPRQGKRHPLLREYMQVGQECWELTILLLRERERKAEIKLAERRKAKLERLQELANQLAETPRR